jgi:putative membrane protein
MRPRPASPRLLLVLVALSGVAAVATASGAPAQLSALDRHYLKSSAEGDAFEIQGGKLALRKSSDPEVRKLARTLVKDHSKSLSETEALASRLGVKVESKPEPPQQWELSIVSTGSGRLFDIWYAKLEVQDHKQDITDASEERNTGTNSKVRASASKELPDLRKHLALSRAALK